MNLLTFWQHVDTSAGPEGCWLWAAACTTWGYGTAYIDGHLRSAHRAAYESLVGEVAAGLVLDHLCRTRRCVNPDRLEAVTQRTNVLLRGEGLAAINARKTTCLHGHPLTPENVYLCRGRRDVPKRLCKTCDQLRRALRG